MIVLSTTAKAYGTLPPGPSRSFLHLVVDHIASSLKTWLVPIAESQQTYNTNTLHDQ